MIDITWKVDRSWSEEEARNLHKEVLENHPNIDWWQELKLPFHQWVALRELDVHEERYEQGDHKALLRALRLCCIHGLVVPDWVARDFVEKLESVFNYRKMSLDDAFGRIIPKGTHLEVKRKKLEIKLELWLYAQDLLGQESGLAIDDLLFERVGKRFDIGKTKAKEIYYDADRGMTSELRQLIEATRAAGGLSDPNPNHPWWETIPDSN